MLQLLDELTLTLPQKIRKESQAAAGDSWVAHPADAIVDRLVDLGRTGKSGGAGFYEYVDGKRTGLWPGLRTEFGATNHDVDLHELSERMLVIEALETQRCFDEACWRPCPTPTSARSSVSASRPGPAGSCSTSRASRAGVAGFVARADELAAKYGDRFSVPDSLRAEASGPSAAA